MVLIAGFDFVESSGGIDPVFIILMQQTGCLVRMASIAQMHKVIRF
jgi:hypothetical protein